MRSVLSLALLLLALTLALNHGHALFSKGPADARLADAAMEIVIGAKGPLLPAAPLGTGPERIGEAIRLGDRTLVGTGASGIRAAFLGSDFALRAERCFDVARSQEDARALRAAVEEAEWGEILVLASSGRLEPEQDESASTELDQALALLGARARVGTATPESWALLALRLEQGWVPLAEGYSRDSGVALSFVLALDLESHANFEPDLVLVRAGERSEVFLEEELHHASLRTMGVELARTGLVGGRRMAGILLPPIADPQGGASPGRLIWSDVELGTQSGLIVWLGLADGASDGSDGATCEVRVDGETVAQRVVLPEAPWRVLQVDLKRFGGRKVDLELRVDPGQTARGDAVLWGRPMLLHGYDRSPQQIWAEER